jgi:hypothetical protein
MHSLMSGNWKLWIDSPGTWVPRGTPGSLEFWFLGLSDSLSSRLPWWWSSESPTAKLGHVPLPLGESSLWFCFGLTWLSFSVVLFLLVCLVLLDHILRQVRKCCIPDDSLCGLTTIFYTQKSPCHPDCPSILLCIPTSLTCSTLLLAPVW